MVTRTEMLLEAERRGILPPEQQDMLNEARNRGIVPQVSPPQEAGAVREALRVPGQALAGFQERSAEVVGALPDLVSQGLAAIGVPQPEVGFFTQTIKDALQTAGQAIGEPLAEAGLGLGPVEPRGGREEAARAAGEGAASAASVALPAAAVAGRTQGITQGVSQALAAQPATQLAAGAVGGAVEQATDSPLLGTAAALATPLAAAAPGRLIRPIRNQLSREGRRLAGIAADEGIPLTAGQRSGSQALRRLEDTFETLPLTSGPQRAISERQQTAFNRAVLRRAGVDADTATPEVVDGAFRNLGRQFDDLSARTVVQLDDDFGRAINATTNEFSRVLPSEQRGIFGNILEDIASFGRELPGDVYQTTRSRLTRRARSIAQSDPELSNAFRGVRDALDDAAGRSVAPQLRDQWREIRTQYRNLKAISNAISRPSAGAAEGSISPAVLQSAVRQGQTRDAFARGSGELNDLARVGQRFLKPPPDSGTAQRRFFQELLTGGGALGGFAVGGDLLSGGLGFGAALFGPRVAQRAINLQGFQNFLSGGLPIQAGRLAQSGPQVGRDLIGAILAGRGAQSGQEAFPQITIPSGGQ